MPMVSPAEAALVTETAPTDWLVAPRSSEPPPKVSAEPVPRVPAPVRMTLPPLMAVAPA